MSQPSPNQYVPESRTAFPCQNPALNPLDRAAIAEAGRLLACQPGAAFDMVSDYDLATASAMAARIEQQDPHGPYAIAKVYLRPDQPNPDVITCAYNRAVARCVGCCFVGDSAPAV